MTGPLEPQEHRRQALECAALEVSGALAPSEDQIWVREHIASGCDICTDAAARVSELLDELLLAASPVEPPPALRARVLECVRTDGERAPDREPDAHDIQIWNRWAPAGSSEFTTLFASDQEWEETAVAGIVARPLLVDQDQSLVTMMVRMEPGTSYPPHRHAAGEHCYVLHGDLSCEGNVLHAGDYHFAPAGSIHDVQSTEGGCTLLITSSRSDQLLT